jgi:beta-apo-4'-carotenal oxygenase
VIGAIAAGCTAVIKPSENAPNVAVALQKVIEDSLDPTSFKCVQGAVKETTSLLNEKWDKIFYTGSANVGTIIAKKAAETLTPVCLELGGRNPAIITKNADVRLAARRLLWGKILNAGQVCISHNYTIVDKEVLDQYIQETKTALAEFFPNGVRNTTDYGRIINSRQFSRLKKMLDDTHGKIIIGGETDEKDLYIAPTMILVDSPQDSLIAEESFGPFMPVLPVPNLDAAIRIANEVHSTPLGLYAFGTQKETDRCLSELRSGGATVNDTFYHGAIPTIPFGGVGDSGQGAYRGRASFDCFSHRRTIAKTPNWMEGLLNVRYPPYDGKLAKLRMASEMKPNFDREGRVSSGLAGYILGLGAGSKKGGFVRYLVVILGEFC